MVPMGANPDEWIADVASYIRNSFGNTGAMVTPEQVAAVRKVSIAQVPVDDERARGRAPEAADASAVPGR